MFAGAAFTGALLLFLLEPMFVKMALPRLGGSSEVWTACVLFYQIVLLAGYAYAHLLRKVPRVAHQALIHGVLCGSAIFTLPLSIPAAWQPASADGAVTWLIAALVRTVGLPFFVLAATSPLMQSWFALARPGQNPYPLYAASNVGSLAALVLYPFVFEPLFGLRAQSVAWAAAYVVFVLLLGLCAFEARGLVVQTTAESLDGAAPITLARRARWVALAFVPASLMLSVTTYLSERVAPIPLMWTLPLGIYLASFVIVFATSAKLSIAAANRYTPIFLIALVFVMSLRLPLPVAFELPLHLIVFAGFAIVCHGAIATDKPEARQLTEFFLFVALGGVLGGAFNSVVAPVIFADVYEYPIVLVFACLALVPRAGTQRRRNLWADIAPPAILGLALVAILITIPFEPVTVQVPTALLAIGAATFVCFTFLARPLRLALGIAALLAVTTLHGFGSSNDLLVERNFYGVKHVSRSGTIHALAHGHTVHGAETMSRDLERSPLTYYTRTGPLGDIFGALQHAHAAVAVIGLGAGSTACYRAPGAAWTFYEIDPGVVAIARDKRLFRYLADCAPDSPIIVGDGRLSLSNAAPHAFNMILLDAYASDAIPTHLLTREAMQVYASRLAAQGTIVFHVSNAYFNFVPLVAALAKDAGMIARYRTDDEHRDTATYISSSTWMVVARSTADLGSLARDPRWTSPRATTRVWTDDYSSIITILRT